jgi:hypothetical protein
MEHRSRNQIVTAIFPYHLCYCGLKSIKCDSIILKLAKSADLDQNVVMRFCSLNFRKNRSITDEMPSRVLKVDNRALVAGMKQINIHFLSGSVGMRFRGDILQPHEKIPSRRVLLHNYESKTETKDNGM